MAAFAFEMFMGPAIAPRPKWLDYGVADFSRQWLGVEGFGKLNT